MNIQIFKTGERYSSTNMPAINSQCFYIPCIFLTTTIAVPTYRKCLKEYIKPYLQCTVIRKPNKKSDERPKLKNLVEVKFRNQDETDLVSPCFLVSLEFTREGMQMSDI